MYIIKSGALYFDGVGFTSQQKDAKRLAMDRPTPTFVAYLDLLFDNAARFVKLTPNLDRVQRDVQYASRSAQLGTAYDNGFDDGRADAFYDDWSL